MAFCWASLSNASAACLDDSPVRAIRAAIVPLTSGAAKDVPDHRAKGRRKSCRAGCFGGSW